VKRPIHDPIPAKDSMFGCVAVVLPIVLAVLLVGGQIGKAIVP